MMNWNKSLGFGHGALDGSDPKWTQYINLKLAAMGCSTVQTAAGEDFEELASALLMHHRETDRLLANYLCPADWRVQKFLSEYFYDTGSELKLPGRTFVLDRHGLARVLSLPVNQDSFASDIVSSYRVKQGVLHNPKSDRRTTEGIFHVAEGGLPIPDDKRAVPRVVAARLLGHALRPPSALMRLPFTATQPEAAECFVSLLLRPTVCPAVPGRSPHKSMEIRFFAPGNLVSNLDFVESIFGNAGDPYLPENDAGLDAAHWSGHTGCVILAPHLIVLTKKELGLPAWEQASERQRRDKMCWRDPAERYNDGQAFKITCRDAGGVMVTVIADNYFGYCKKEVKTQISFAANLFGGCEEEHAGGALVYTSYDLGEEFSGNLHVRQRGHSFAEVVGLFGDRMNVHADGWAADKRFPNIIYVPGDVHFDLHKQVATWPRAGGGVVTLRLAPGNLYVRPSGYKVRLEKPPGYNRAWRLVGTVAEPTFCHKPCTVSGGGKSEISKPITDAILTGPVFVADFKADFDRVAELIGRNYEGRFADTSRRDARLILSSERSLGSVIKLLTPDEKEYAADYNTWLAGVPQYVKELVFVVKRYYKPEWGEDWRSHFSVDIINGTPGNELKLDNRKLVTTYLRVGFSEDGAWRTFGLRKDFHPAFKLQTEDDISASVVASAQDVVGLNPDYAQTSVKFVQNCEYRLFQRPDDAIHRGYDKLTEADFARPGNFFSNYQPLTVAEAQALVEDFIGFEKFTPEMQRCIKEVAEQGRPHFFVSSAHPRLVDQVPTKNPRYLQTRPDLVQPDAAYLAEIGTRLHRRLGGETPLPLPVNAVLTGRRNNPPDVKANIRSLAVYNPIHYMELPELFMEFICSMTGKSPSTTGAGSEGALTKGPFNALLPIYDLNAAFVSLVLTGDQGFVTAAGYVGPNVRVDHDISLLVPEVWCRMSVEEREAGQLIAAGFLEPLEDYDYQGRRILASRLGYRITAKFARAYFGRVFNHPHLVLTPEMLRPELQDRDLFAQGVENIIATQQRVAAHYFNDGSVALACPPLRALLHVMRDGHSEGLQPHDPKFRQLFDRKQILASEWYRERLLAKHRVDEQLWQRHVKALEAFSAKTTHVEEARRLGIPERLQQARAQLARVRTGEWVKTLVGSIGVQPELAPKS